MDPTFNPGGTGVFGGLYAVAMQPDGKILIGGRFTSYNGDAAGMVTRLNADGTRDQTFTAPGIDANCLVRSLLMQPDGKLLVGGSFSIYNGNYGGIVRRLFTINPSPAPSLTKGPIKPSMKRKQAA